MSAEDADPSVLAFWKRRLADHTILTAIKRYPEDARRIFGVLPAMRGDVLQLGMILGARQILSEPVGKMSFEAAAAIEQDLRKALEELAPAKRAECEKALTQDAYEHAARDMAKKIIRYATGEEV